jgi:hypothetical protein
MTMHKLSPILATLVLSVGAACGGESNSEPTEPEAQDASGLSAPTATNTTETDGAITIPLEEENASGQAGTAVLRATKKGKFEVLIEMSPPAKFAGEAQNAHIHDVTCVGYARMKSFNARLGTVVDWLPNLSDGRARGTVDAPLAERTTGTFAINVHEQNDPYTVVACGDIPRQ